MQGARQAAAVPGGLEPPRLPKQFVAVAIAAGRGPVQPSLIGRQEAAAFLGLALVARQTLRVPGRPRQYIEAASAPPRPSPVTACQAGDVVFEVACLCQVAAVGSRALLPRHAAGDAAVLRLRPAKRLRLPA